MAESGSTQNSMQEALFTIAKMNGYTGPKSSESMNAFFSSSPALQAKARAIGSRMAKGGVVKRNTVYASDGVLVSAEPPKRILVSARSAQGQAAGLDKDNGDMGYIPNPAWATWNAQQSATPTATTPTATTPTATTPTATTPTATTPTATTPVMPPEQQAQADAFKKQQQELVTGSMTTTATTPTATTTPATYKAPMQQLDAFNAKNTAAMQQLAMRQLYGVQTQDAGANQANMSEMQRSAQEAGVATTGDKPLIGQPVFGPAQSLENKLSQQQMAELRRRDDAFQQSTVLKTARETVEILRERALKDAGLTGEPTTKEELDKFNFHMTNLMENSPQIQAARKASQEHAASMKAEIFKKQQQDLITGNMETTAPDVEKIGAPTTDQLISAGTGQVTPTAPTRDATTVGAADTVDVTDPIAAETMDATQVGEQVRAETAKTQAAQGEITEGATVTAQQGELSPGAIAEAMGVDEKYIQEVQAGTRQVSPEEIAQAAVALNVPQAEAAKMLKPYEDVEAATFDGETPVATAQDQYTLPPTAYAKMQATTVEEAAKATEYPTAEAARTGYQSTLQAAQGSVGANELVQAKDIVAAEKAVEATAATMSAVNEAAIATAARGSFSQDQLAQAAQGTVPPSATVQGQMADLMNQFNDGTPAWAAGAMRAANAAMAARGLGASSMAGAAIVQATMEAALPIAQQDAQAFQQMNLTNVSNRQQVALANAAASQNMELTNLSNEQAAALQNSAQAFNLQSQNLSNEQAVVLANAQMKAALQGRTLDIKTQTALANAGKYAELNKLNLTNQQQSAITRSSQNLEIDLTNLTNEQQSAITALQVRAGLVGQELSNEQQVAMLTSQQTFETAKFDASAKQSAFMQDAQAAAALEGRAMDARQQTQIFNVSKQIEERGIELNNEQQTRLFNATKRTDIAVQELSNRQQVALANAQIDATIEGKELDNRQQAAIIKSERFAEAANMTFSAEERAQLQNSELMKTVGLAELNTKQATVLQNAAKVAGMDMANLTNRQQAEVQNAQAFLQMDMANMTNDQQTILFKAQQNIQALFTDQAADNAAKQFNASSVNQTEQFFTDLAQRTMQFNTAQSNAMRQFDATSVNEQERFNSELQQQRDVFNANNTLLIAQANTQWRQSIATTDTAAQNMANRDLAAAENGLTGKNLDAIWQEKRDLMSYATQTENNNADRATQIATQVLINQGRIDETDAAKAAEAAKAGGAITATVVDTLVDIGKDWAKSKLGLD